VAVSELVAAHDGRIVLEAVSLAAETTTGGTPLYEFAWNHATLQMLKLDRSVTYLQSLFPAADPLASVRRMQERFGDELPMHLEFVRAGASFACSGLQIVRFTTEARLAEIIAIHEADGISIANPHAYTIEDGSGHKRAFDHQLAFKGSVDPRGLLNPGKMRDYVLIEQVGTAAE
ncbi:MAG: FAD-binding oxidoreductase, partial [Janthinobacterium lividum]